MLGTIGFRRCCLNALRGSGFGRRVMGQLSSASSVLLGTRLAEAELQSASLVHQVVARLFWRADAAANDHWQAAAGEMKLNEIELVAFGCLFVSGSVAPEAGLSGCIACDKLGNFYQEQPASTACISCPENTQRFIGLLSGDTMRACQCKEGDSLPPSLSSSCTCASGPPAS